MTMIRVDDELVDPSDHPELARSLGIVPDPPRKPKRPAECSGCGREMNGPAGTTGRCSACLELARRARHMEPVPGTRHRRRRIAGISRSKAGR